MKFLSLVLMASQSIWAGAAWFPLAVGNEWVYRLDEGPVKDIKTARITGQVELGKREYFVYEGIMGERLRLRYNSEGQVVRWLEDGSEALWADFAAEEGQQYNGRVDDCTGMATVESRDAKLELPLRTFKSALVITYAPGGCADAGVTRDVFVQGVGLVEREYTSFSGPRRYKLSSARIDDTVVHAAGEHAFRFSLDRTEYPEQFRYLARITIENTTGTPLLLRFPSGQIYELTIRDANGNPVYRWSNGKFFPQVVLEERIEGERNWTVSEAVQLAPGRYVFEARLQTVEESGYTATVPFTVRSHSENVSDSAGQKGGGA